MHFSYLLLLLLVILSAYSESPHHVKPLDFLDPTSVAVCPNSTSTQLGILSPCSAQNEVYEINMLQNEVGRIILLRMRLSGIKLFCLSLRCSKLM